MVTDKLRIKGGSNLNSAGKAGTAKPQAKLEDPFKDDGPSPATAADTITSKASTTKEEPIVVPAKAGRSRLILQPKKKE